jgi:putative DNA primase/helicase
MIDQDISFQTLVAHGYALVPIPIGQKGPISPDWNCESRCLTEPAQLAKYPQKMNFGLAHAYCTPRPTCAIDIDVYREAKPWLSDKGVDIDALLSSEDAVVIHSGKKFSLKLIYRLRPSEIKESIKIFGASQNCILEFRCGTKDKKTVQDVLPPSIHPSGTTYQWYGHGDPLAPPSLRKTLRVIWDRQIEESNKKRYNKQAVKHIHQSIIESPRQVATIQNALKYIDASCSYEIWRNVIWALLSTDWQCAEDLALKWSMSAPDKFEEKVFWSTVASFSSDHESPITLATLIFHARNGGWDG